MINYPWQDSACKRLVGVSDVLEGSAKKIWSVDPPLALFAPIAKQGMGHVGTDFPIRLARLLKMPIPVVVKQLLNGLDPQADFAKLFCIYEGFLNLRIDSAFLQQLNLDRDSFTTENISIYIPRLTSQYSNLSYLRLAAIAIFQMRLLLKTGKNVTLHLGNELFGPESWQYLFEHIGTRRERNELDAEEAAEILLCQVRSSSSKNIFVWGSENLLTKRQYQELRKSKDIVYRYVPDVWLYGEEFSEANFSIADFSAAQLHAFEIYLAGVQEFNDLDLTVPGNSECANLRWYTEATHRRVEKFLQALIILDTDSSNHKCYEDLGVTVGLLPWLMEISALRGEVWEYLSALKSALDGINQIVNDPKFSFKCAEGTIARNEKNLLVAADKFLKFWNKV